MAAKKNLSSVDEFRQQHDMYVRTFTAPSAEKVLEDLARFCRADRTCFHADPRIHAMLEGRREVYLRIKEYIDNDHDELVAIRSKALSQKLHMRDNV